MTGQRAGIGRELWLAGLAAGLLAMALVLAGMDMAIAALAGFAVGLGLYALFLLGPARKR